MSLFINEIFGPTIQGEGSAAGRHCLFVRTADCNLACKWCDTAYTWSFNEHKAANLEVPIVYDKATNRKEMEPEEIVNVLKGLWDIDTDPTTIIISGGEPLMQAKRLEPLVQQLIDRENDVHIETAGTLMPGSKLDALVTQYNVSPKLEHSGNRLELRRKPEVLKFFGNSDKAWFKFVMRSPEDFDEVDEIVQLSEVYPDRVMVMPEGVTAEKNMEIAKTLIDGAIERGYGLTYRTHILLWKDVRGK